MGWLVIVDRKVPSLSRMKRHRGLIHDGDFHISLRLLHLLHWLRWRNWSICCHRKGCVQHRSWLKLCLFRLHSHGRLIYDSLGLMMLYMLHRSRSGGIASYCMFRLSHSRSVRHSLRLKLLLRLLGSRLRSKSRCITRHCKGCSCKSWLRCRLLGHRLRKRNVCSGWPSVWRCLAHCLHVERIGLFLFSASRIIGGCNLR